MSSEPDIDVAMLRRLGARHAPLVRLRPYQRMACDFAMTHPRCGLFLPIGAGKTLSTLELVYELDLPTHVLIVGPKQIMRSTWGDEIDKWGFPFRVQSLLVDDQGRKLSKAAREARYAEVLASDPSVWFINRDLVCDLVGWMHANAPSWPFGFVILDEAQSFKSCSAKRFKALCSVSPQIERLVELTGTPAPNGLMDLWSLVYLMDGGQRLGRNITAYRRTWFHPKFCVNDHPVGWEPNPGAADAIETTIADICLTFDAVRDHMPPVTIDDVPVTLSKSERDAYHKLERESVLDFESLDDESSVSVGTNAAVLRSRLRQLASGTQYALQEEMTPEGRIRYVPKRDASGESVYGVIHERKVSALREICESAGSPVLVAYYFRAEASLLADRLSDLGCEVFDGSPGMLRRWNAREIPVMLIQPASAGFGLNMQAGGHTLVWFTLPESLEQYQQTNGRLARSGQTEPVIIHRLVARGTVDSIVLAALGEKAQVQDDVMDAVRADGETLALYRLFGAALPSD